MRRRNAARASLVVMVAVAAAVGCAGLVDLDRVRYEARDDAGAPADASPHDARTADGPDATVPGTPALVQYGVGEDEATNVPTTILPTTAGNLVVVAVAVNTHSTGSIVSITDDAPGGSNTYVSTGYTSTDDRCDDSAEVWYAKDVRPGATTVTVNMTAKVEISTWVMELSGLSRTDPVDTGAVRNDGLATRSPTAPPVTPSVPNAVVVSIGVSCGFISNLRSGSPFTNLPVRLGHATAYLITKEQGSYGAAWTSDEATFNASTVAFK